MSVIVGPPIYCSETMLLPELLVTTAHLLQSFRFRLRLRFSLVSDAACKYTEIV